MTLKYLIIASIVALLSSCSDSFIKHELKVQKIGDCSVQVSPVKMNPISMANVMNLNIALKMDLMEKITK